MVSGIRYTQDPEVSRVGDWGMRRGLSLESPREISDSHFQLQVSISQSLHAQ